MYLINIYNLALPKIAFSGYIDMILVMCGKIVSISIKVELLEEADLFNRVRGYLGQGDKVFAEITKTSSGRWKILITQKQIEERPEEKDVEHIYKYGIKVRDSGLEKTYVDLNPVLNNLKNTGLTVAVIHLT